LKCSILATPPWVFKRPHIDYSIHQSFKENTSPEIYRNKFFEFCDYYKDFSRLYTDDSRMGNQVAVIFSDSMSSLQALSIFRLEIHFVQNIIKDYTHLTNSGKTIILCWIPSHVNIVGNERADTASKSALSLPITNMKLPAGELFPLVSKFCLNEWQEIWDCCECNKLHSTR